DWYGQVDGQERKWRKMLSQMWTIPVGRYPSSIEVMTTTETTPQIPVRLDFDAITPGFSRAMAQLDQAAIKQLDKVDLDHRLRELVRIRASQLNGCAYCIDMHTKDA